MTSKKIVKLILSLGIITSSAISLGSPTSYALKSDPQLAYTANKSINEQYDIIRELWHGNQNNRSFYISATNSIRTVNRGWHILYGKQYYVDENNQWLVNVEKKIDGVNWRFGIDGTVSEMWYDF